MIDELISKGYLRDDSWVEIDPLLGAGWETLFSCDSSAGNFANQRLDIRAAFAIDVLGLPIGILQINSTQLSIQAWMSF